MLEYVLGPGNGARERCSAYHARCNEQHVARTLVFVFLHARLLFVIGISGFVLSQYNMGFYFNYLAAWPDYFAVSNSASGRMMGYSELLGRVCTTFFSLAWSSADVVRCTE